MEKIITTTFNSNEFKKLIIEAVKEVTLQNDLFDTQKEERLIYLDQREAAKFLRISLPTIIRWKKANKIPYYQEGRKVLFRKDELLKVLQKNDSLLK